MSYAIPLLRKHGVPLSRQLYAWFRHAALTGVLSPGECLPSTRDLAEQLQVSRTVVLAAYEQLLAEGFVVGHHGSGTYVAEGLARKSVQSTRRSAPLKLSRFGSFAAASIQRAIPVKRRQPGLRYDFSYRSSPASGFPLEQWHRILTRIIRRATVSAHEYSSAQGSHALREAIAFHLRRSRAVQCDSGQIIVVNGSQQALDLAARVLLDRGDRVVMEDPHYQGAAQAFLAAGAQLYGIAVDRDGLNTQKLPSRARLAFVTPSHQFPTGTILPLARRLALLDWAKRTDAIIIEDDYDGEFRYEGQPVESMQGLDSEGRVIYVGTFSRTMFPSLRIGYLIAPKSLVPAFAAVKWLSDRHTPTLEQEALAEFITSGAYERYLRRARKANALRREALIESVEKFLDDRVQITGEGSGAHVVLWLRKRVAEADIIARAAAQGVGIYGTANNFLKRPSKTGILLGYSNMREQDIREGVRRLANVI